MKIKQKSTFTEQAQYAAFADEASIAPLERSLTLNRLGEEVFRSTVAPPQDYEHLGSNDYPAYLRSVGGRRHNTIQGRAELLENFARFEPAIALLRNELTPLTDRHDHAAFVGAGGNMRAFEINVDGSPYIVREALDGQTKVADLDARIITGVLTKDIPHTEQIIAASYTQREVVAERAPGCTLDELTSEEIRGITDDQIKDLIDTVVDLHQRDIKIDYKISNAFYDPEAGYTLIDLDHWSDLSKNCSTYSVLIGVASMLSAAGNRALNGSPVPTSSAGFRENYDVLMATKDLMARYQEQACQRLSTEDQAALSDRIKALQVDNYKDASDYERRLNPDRWFEDYDEAV